MKTFFALALFLMTAGGACSAQSDSQSLADVAKQNRQNKKAAHVIDQDDVTRGVISVVGNESSQAAAPATDSSGKVVADNSKPAPSGNNSQVAELKKKLDSYKKEQQSWKDSAQKHEDQLSRETDDFRRTTYQESLDNDKKAVAALQQRIDQTNANLTRAQNEQQATAGSASGKTSTAAPQQQ